MQEKYKIDLSRLSALEQKKVQAGGAWNAICERNKRLNDDLLRLERQLKSARNILGNTESSLPYAEMPISGGGRGIAADSIPISDVKEIWRAEERKLIRKINDTQQAIKETADLQEEASRKFSEVSDLYDACKKFVNETRSSTISENS